MAFVYCEKRWHLGKENSSPGPAEYCITENHERPHYQPKIAKSPPRIKQSFTSSPNILLSQPEQTAARRSVKKGKLHRNHSNIVRDCKENQLEKTELKVTIKNAMHTYGGIASSRNKWGNMRIKEMLNEHKQRELKKQIDQLHKRNNSRDISCEVHQKSQEGLKQLQGFFLSQRKGSNPVIVKKSNISNISKKQARHFSYNQLRVSEIIKEDLQVEPTLVYVKENNNNEFHKKQESSMTKISPLCSLGESKIVFDYSIPTGIEGEQEDSLQYISEATPGPGSYNPYLPNSKVSTKIEKFGVTMERFSCNKKKQLQAQTPITPHQPAYRVSSKANQDKVGFGRSKKQGLSQKSTTFYGEFYDDNNSLQKQAQMLLQKGNSKIGFGSCKERFQDNTNSNEQQIYQPVQQQQQQDFQQQKPTCVFLSKVNRELYVQKPELGAQFLAQNAFCLADKLKNSKNRIEDYDLKPAPFLSNSNRFMYHHPLLSIENKSPKNLLDQQPLPKENKRINILESPKRGFSFGKQQRREKIQETSPSPGEYQSTPQWIKASYNIRFT